MKKQVNSYANVRVGFYESRFQSRTNQQLVNEFNQLANSRGWTAERSYFSVALMNEMIRREMDVSAISELMIGDKCFPSAIPSFDTMRRLSLWYH